MAAALKIHFDMETRDPDDVIALAILATHPRAELVGVTLTPGSPDQIGLVTHVLDRLGVRVPIGGDPAATKDAVSPFHDEWLGRHSQTAHAHAADILEASAALGATLLTGGPLKNLARLPRFTRWVAQGGFAGDSVVPAAHRLPKFEGKETQPTFNFNHAPKIALAMLESPHIPEKILVSKNVCHGVGWSPAFHARVAALAERTAGLDLVFEGMKLYLAANAEGKLLHDPLALAIAIDPSIAEFRSVRIYREKGEWGSRLDDASDVRITIAVDEARFFEVLTALR